MMEQPNGSWQDPRRDGWQPPQYEYVPRPAPKRGRAPLIITL